MATAMEGLTVYNLPPSPANWDQIGVFYIAFCCTWTTLVIGGIAFLLWNRRLHILRVRGLPLSITAIAFLHAYWILAQIAYPVGMTMNLVLAYDIQYFVMGIYFPLGIALFHASNSRFLHVAKLQKKYAHPTGKRQLGCNGAKTSWLCKLRNMDYQNVIFILIGLGMIAQV
jgi:hypothetical protein